MDSIKNEVREAKGAGVLLWSWARKKHWRKMFRNMFRLKHVGTLSVLIFIPFRTFLSDEVLSNRSMDSVCRCPHLGILAPSLQRLDFEVVLYREQDCSSDPWKLVDTHCDLNTSIHSSSGKSPFSVFC